MNKFKVIQILPELNIGGVERGTKDLSKVLVDKGHESIVISNGGIFENDIVKNGGKHYKVPVHKKSLLSLRYSKTLKEIYLSEKPDIVHVRSRMPAWINYFAFKKLLEKPILISTFHGLYSTPAYSQVMSKADHIIAISNTVRNYIKDTYKVSDDKITTIPRGCDPLTFNKTPLNEEWLNSWYLEFPQTKNKTILTLPTRISKWKGVDSFIELFKLLECNKFHGLIVGPTSKSKKRYFNDLKRKIKNYNLQEKITFTGQRKDISNVYKISNIVFNLSVKPEPFGRTTIEAISSGSKVIGWDHGGTQEILDELFPEGLVELNNIVDLKNKVLEISHKDHPDPKENIYTLDRMTSKTINLYQQLLNNDL